MQTMELATFRGPPKPMTNFLVGIPGPPGPAGPPGGSVAIEVPFGAASTASAAQIPAGAIISMVFVVVGTVFSGGSGPTVTVTVNAVTVFPSATADLTATGPYVEFVGSAVAAASVVTVTFGGTATAGAGKVIVIYNPTVQS
jgi:hypothetical protein